MPDDEREVWRSEDLVTSATNGIGVWRLGPDGRAAELVARVHGRTREEAAARARLIAQAPALLACVRALAEAAGLLHDSFHDADIARDQILTDMYRAMREALESLRRAGLPTRCEWCRAETPAFASVGKTWCSGCGHRAGIGPARCDCPGCAPALKR